MLFVMMLFTLQGFYWLIGKRASEQVADEKDYFLANKQVALLPLMMTFLATQVGGGVVLGAAEEAYKYGWPVLFYPLGGSIGLLLLGLGIGKALASFNVSTVAELFEVIYRSRGLRRFASLLSIVSLFMILIAQVIGSKKFLVSMGLDNPYLFVLFWGLIIYYTAKGGLKAVISTDLVQAAFFSTVFLLCFGWVAIGASPDFWPQLTAGKIEAVADQTVGWLILPMLFMVIGQDMGQRCFAGASFKVVARAASIAGVLSFVVCLVPIFLGIYAASVGISVPEGGSVLMTTVAAATNPAITALVGCAVIAAILSTATSLINAISSNLAGDFSWSFIPKIDPLRRVQVMTGLIAALAIGAAFCFNSIVDMLMFSYDLSLSCLCVPLLIGLYRRQGSSSAAIGSVLFGLAGFLLFRFYPIVFPREIAAMLLSLAGYWVGAWCRTGRKITVVSAIIVLMVSTAQAEELTGVTIRSVSSEDWQEFRDLRLKALAENPIAYGIAVSDESGRSEAEWRAICQDAQQGNGKWFFIAEYEGRWIGMLGAQEQNGSYMRHLVEIVSAYVDPDFRRTGVMTQLSTALKDRLMETPHVEQMIAWVTLHDHQSGKYFSEVLGFKYAGKLSRVTKYEGRYYDCCWLEASLRNEE